MEILMMKFSTKKRKCSSNSFERIVLHCRIIVPVIINNPLRKSAVDALKAYPYQ